MKPQMKHSSSMKAKNNAQIHMLQNDLFSKLETVEPLELKLNDLDFKMNSYPQDSLSQLIGRAKGITTVNQDKIQKAKRQLRVSQKQSGGMFLTGTGMYAVQVQEQPPVEQVNFTEEVDPQSMLKQLVKRDGEDDLAELRRMIKVTGKNLNQYQEQVYQSKKDVMHAADQFNSQIDFNLTCKLNKVKKPSRKANSMARFKSRYN